MKTRGLFKSLFISFFALNSAAWGSSESSGNNTENDSIVSLISGKTKTHIFHKQSENFDQELKILLIGPSGHGKSSLINTIANLTSGKKAADQKDFLIKTQYDGYQFPCTVDRYQSRNVEVSIDPSYFQTIASSSYNTGTAEYIFLNQDQTKTSKIIKLTMVDTPGLDIGGANGNGSESFKNAIDKVSNATQLNAIALVIDGTSAMSSRLGVVNSFISEFQKALPEKYKDNLIVVFTRPVSQSDDLFAYINTKGVNAKNYVSFDNSALFAHTIPVIEDQEAELSDDEFFYDPNAENRLELVRSKIAWSTNKGQLAKMVKLISEMEPR